MHIASPRLFYLCMDLNVKDLITTRYLEKDCNIYLKASSHNVLHCVLDKLYTKFCDVVCIFYYTVDIILQNIGFECIPFRNIISEDLYVVCLNHARLHSFYRIRIHSIQFLCSCYLVIICYP